MLCGDVLVSFASAFFNSSPFASLHAVFGANVRDTSPRFRRMSAACNIMGAVSTVAGCCPGTVMLSACFPGVVAIGSWTSDSLFLGTLPPQPIQEIASFGNPPHAPSDDADVKRLLRKYREKPQTAKECKLPFLNWWEDDMEIRVPTIKNITKPIILVLKPRDGQRDLFG